MMPENRNTNRMDAETLVRMLNLFYNRTISYSFDHPYVQEIVPRVYESFQKVLGPTGSISLLFQELGFFIGSVDVAYQPNNRRIADHLRRFGVEALSVSAPLGLPDLNIFLDACTLTHADPQSFLTYLHARGTGCFSVNDVTLQTVKEGEVVGLAGGMGEGGPGPREGEGGEERAARNPFDDMAMKVVLGHVTASEMGTNLGILQLLQSPTALSQAVAQAAAATPAAPGAEGASIQHALYNVLGAYKTKADDSESSIEEILGGMYRMRSELLKALKTQQNFNDYLATRNGALDEASEKAFDETAAQLIVAEYKKTQGNVKRMAQVIQRIVPDKQQLQRIMPLLKTELTQAGVPLIEFYNLLGELNTLLYANQSYHEFVQAGEAMGVSADELLKELSENPKQAAQLIMLASEVKRINRDQTGDFLIKSLGEYVEKAGEALGREAMEKPTELNRLSGMLFQMENALSRQIEERNLPESAKAVVQQNLRHRTQRYLNDLKGRAVMSQLRNPGATEEEKVRFLLEVYADEKELEEGLGLGANAREDALAKEISGQILQKVRLEMASRKEKAMSKELPQGVYVKAVLDFFIKYEISRANRYQLPFSSILISFQGLPEDKDSQARFADALRGLQNVLIGDLRTTIREVDFVGCLAFNRFLVVLPMTKAKDVERIVKKFQDTLNRQVALPDGSRVWVRPRCGIASFDKDGLNSYARIYNELVRTWQANV